MAIHGFHEVYQVEGTAVTLMQVLSVEDSIRVILKPEEFLDYKSCISEFSISSWNSEDATLTLPWEIYKHPPFYEEDEMLLDISFVKEYDALRAFHNYQQSGALGHT